jgi:hypothetical protein
MKPRFWLTMVCWALACLVLGLSQQAGLYHSSQVSGSSQWLDQCREPASGSRTASVFKSTQFDPARARSLTSLVLEDAWPERNIGPPGQENPWATRRRAVFAGCRSKTAVQNNNEPPCPREFLAQPTEFEKSEVLQQPLARPRRTPLLFTPFYGFSTTGSSTKLSWPGAWYTRCTALR